MRIGFHASHEEWSPSELLRQVARAEAAGFHAAMCSDHFHPWSEDQAQSGFSWSWLGAAMARSELSFGTVCAPGQRYHPCIVAQAAATLAEMFPGRFWLALGSGENLNEHITGEAWPEKSLRQARLRECATIIRTLWAGDAVNHDGLVTVRDARLYTRPPSPPLLLGAALSAETAAWMAPWVDGLITAGSRHEDLVKLVAAFRDHGGAEKPLFLQSAVAFASTREKARAEAFRLWRQAALEPETLADGPTPAYFDERTRHVDPRRMDELLRVSGDIEEHLDWLRQDAALGFDAVYLHFLGADADGMIEAFAERVLPEFAAAERIDPAELERMTVLED